MMSKPDNLKNKFIAILIICKAYSCCATDNTRLTEILRIVEGNYVGVVPHIKYAEDIPTLFAQLDVYSSYLSKEELVKINRATCGQYKGIGVNVQQEHGRMIITDVIRASPAEMAGLKKGDIVLDEQHSKSKVQIVVERNHQPVAIDVSRKNIQIKSVEREIIDGVGLIKIKFFSAQTAHQVKEALRLFGKNNITGLIIDLRDNPGGLLEHVLQVNSLFLRKGDAVVELRFKGYSRIYRVQGGKKYTKIAPIVVIINERSASGAEITAASLVANRAVLVGKRTAGKGSAQSFFKLSDGSAIKITTATFHSPLGQDINNKGIAPHIIADTNNQLCMAINVVRALKK